ncbi:TetR/AcrR family transcriptional regulator [Saccharothrix syringae]|uniref:TetR/AcrR family transcriptional regulator n=1 Tax=Saccharothrix syringae TaxID=103733 RepID=A0A5Q0GZY8_SACSY|nr:TetR/AcrR family transcriptional regulator [Saccharothrix syringae]QFZ19100.1 TetR/AcrR family transcriptional regulator [Saccharothrix syringae]
MPRQTPQELDDEIIDGAAALFARHGFRETSVQRIAAAVGFSKAGLLHHYPSKEALRAAVLRRCLGEVRMITAGVVHRAAGPERDRAALTAVAELALRQPGFVALILAGLSSAPGDDELDEVVAALGEAFGLAPDTDFTRRLRVSGALGALAVARVALRAHLAGDAIGDVPGDAVGHLVDLACDTLGHTG